MSHGTSDTCGPCCTKLVASECGVKRHRFVMLTALYEIEGHVHGVEDAAPKRAWKEVYEGTKFQPSTASIRLGLSPPGKRGDRAGPGPVSIANSRLAQECYRRHLEPASQEIADRQKEIEKEMLRRIEGESLVDLGDFFFDGDPIVAVRKLVRMTINGVNRKGAPGVDGHDLFDAGVEVSYKRGMGPPDLDRYANVARECSAWSLISSAEAKKRGLTKHLSEYRCDRGKVMLKVDKSKMKMLWAQWKGKLSTTLTIQDGEAAIAGLEHALDKAVQLVVPNQAFVVQAAFRWYAGDSVEIAAGAGKVTRSDGETLRMDDRGRLWVEKSGPRRMEEIA